MFDVASGVKLAAGLADGFSSMRSLPVGEEGLGALTDLTVLATQVQAWAAAVKAGVTAELDAQIADEHRASLAELAAVRGTPPTARERSDMSAAAHRQVTATLSLSQGISLWAADRQLDLARATVEHPALYDALGEARLDPGQADMVVRQLKAVPDHGHRARLVQGLVADPDDDVQRRRLFRELRSGGRALWQLPAGKLRDILTREAARLDPDDLTRRAKENHADRSVAFYPTSTEQPLAALLIRGPAHELVAAAQDVDATARAARKAGAPESLDQLRYDIAIGRLSRGTHGLVVTERDPAAGRDQTSGPADGSDGFAGPSTGRTMTLPPLRGTTLVHLLVPDRTMLGLDDDPATMLTPQGAVPIPADLARELAHDPDQALWQRILLDPATGVATDVSRTYRPPKRIATWCQVRDGFQTRFPTASARRIELNHVRRYDHADPEAGGPTSGANLASEGKRTHQGITEGGTHVEGDANDCLTYDTGTGHTYESWPHQYLDPAPAPPEPPPGYDDPPF